jgi:Fic family protein
MAGIMSTYPNLPLVPSQDIQDLRDEIADLKAIVVNLEAKVLALEATRGSRDEKIAALEESNYRHLQLIQDLKDDLKEGRRPSKLSGEKTLARIAKIDEILKSRGPTTLKELERILKISDKEMNRILKRLDDRRYEDFSRPGNKREKVLRLKRTC